jgi:hypothetical protein
MQYESCISRKITSQSVFTFETDYGSAFVEKYQSAIPHNSVVEVN